MKYVVLAFAIIGIGAYVYFVTIHPSLAHAWNVWASATAALFIEHVKAIGG